MCHQHFYWQQYDLYGCIGKISVYKRCFYYSYVPTKQKRGEEKNREEGEMAQKKLGGRRNKGKSREEGEKEKLGVGRIELDGRG